MAEALNVEFREQFGKRNNRRLRRAGKIPAILYGHGQKSVSLAVSAEQLDAAVRHGSRMVSLSGAVSEQAFVRECQWDTWGTHLLHVDFTRVSEHEKVRVHVPVALRGEAPGVKAGGSLKHVIHEIELECEVSAIPEKVAANVNHLELGDSVTVGDLELPEHTVALAEPSQVVVHCIAVAEVPEEEALEEAAKVEPEIIGRKKEEDSEEPR